MDFNTTLGSVWRKWDLHIHSNASDGKGNPEQIIRKAKSMGIEVIALTDHHTVVNLDKIKEIGNQQGVKVISGIEFKTDKGKRSVHIIGLFPDYLNGQELNSAFLYETVLCQLSLAKDKIISEGKKIDSTLDKEEAFKRGVFETFVDFKETARKIREYGGIVIVHAGNKSNGIEDQISHDDNDLEASLAALKRDLMTDCVDVCEVSKDREIEFYWKKFKKPSIMASDAHSLEEIGEKYIWIKAEPTFEGLKQALREPHNRIYFGFEPEIKSRQKKYPEQFIDSLVIKTVESKLPNEKWFTDVPPIHFNSELVAIIGNKGQGKSALTDFIGLAGRSLNYEHYSFLTKNRFLKHPDSKAFSVRMKFNSGTESDVYRIEALNSTDDVEKVKYLPQRFIEDICSEVGNNFQDEIEKIIFSYIEKEDRLNCSNYREFIEVQSQRFEKVNNKLRETLKAVIAQILSLEEKRKPEYKKKLLSSLKDITETLSKIEKPKEIPNPDSQDREHEEKTETVNRIKELQTGQKKKKDHRERITGRIEELRNDAHQLSSLKENLLDVKNRIEILSKENEELTNKYSIQAEELFNFKPKLSSIDVKLESITVEIKENKNNLNTIDAEIRQMEQKIEQLASKITDIQREYIEYLDQTKVFNEKVKQLNEEKDELQREFQYIENDLNGYIKRTQDEAIAISKDILKNLFGKIKVVEETYNPIKARVQDLSQDIPKIAEFGLDFHSGITIKPNTVATILDQYINAGVKGSFCGKEQAEKLIKGIVMTDNGLDLDALDKILTEFLEALYFDIRDSDSIERSKDSKKTEDIDTQFKKENGISKKADFYEYFFGCRFLTTITEIKSQGKTINELSPGEKGAVLLVLYLLLDKGTNPLIIDQPEENLDNQSVYEVLRPFIVKAKERRQVIIVTHNPNIAVACDAEQIIYVEIDKKDMNQFSFESGSIENPAINKRVTQILEGTMPAFNNRKCKYMT